MIRDASRFSQFTSRPGFQQLVVQGQTNQFARNDVIPFSGPYASVIYWVCVGAVSVRLSPNDGEETFVETLHPGDFFGGMISLSDISGKAFFAIATEPSLVLQMSGETFETIACQYPELWKELLAQSSRRSALMASRIQDINKMTIQDRVLAALLSNATGSPSAETINGIEIKVGRQDLADAICCTREMVSKAIQNLKREGKIDLKGRSIVVPHQFL